MAARKNRNRQRRRRGRFGFLYKLLSFLIIFAAILVGCVAFFRVNEVVVTGNERYSAEEIIAASGVGLGDNLFLVNKPQTTASIMRHLPYVERVTPVRRLPDTIEFHITESQAVAAIRIEVTVEVEGVAQTETDWWLINASGKLLERGSEELAVDLPEILGLHPSAPTLGSRLTVELEEHNKLEGLKGLLTALKGRGMQHGVMDFIDLNASNVIYFDYGEDLTVAVPMSGDFDRRAAELQGVLDTFGAQGEQVRGTLDLTYGGKDARLLPDRWLPENWTRREPQDGGTVTAEPSPEPGLGPDDIVPPDISGAPGGEEPEE
ncbi:MAG: FtsQ-type POTRA domain-containing protein [Oscillospiraceae bacterium]|nr:FtsQ-type POTRA domain-containing protein [Oscillospiraceae bacterium]